MINSNTNSNTYDMSAIDARILNISNELNEIKQRLSSCVTVSLYNLDLVDKINNALGTLPTYYITYEELLTYLGSYLSISEANRLYAKKADIDYTLDVDESGATIVNNGTIKLKYINDKLSLEIIEPYVSPLASLTINPYLIEYGTSGVTCNVSVSTSNNNYQSIKITGGSFTNEDITSSKQITDTVDTTHSTSYLVSVVDTQLNTNTYSISTTIGRRVLYGDTEISADTFSTKTKFLSYSGHTIATTNPESITITQSNNKYGWIATPWKIKLFTDQSIGLAGGWITEPTEYTSPYGDGQKYYVYKTVNTSLGSVTWKITNN